MQKVSSHKTITSLIHDRVFDIEPKARILLFGSQARGDARPDSDWDIIVLIRDGSSSQQKDDISYSLFDLGWDIDKQIHPIVYTETEWRNKSFTPFYKNVLKDGIEI